MRLNPTCNRKPLLACIAALLLAGPVDAVARSPEASWDNLCEECHGDADEFSRKYLWHIGGQLQGRHHVDNLPLFLDNHYIPAHELDAMTDMLTGFANTLEPFDRNCGGCHGEAAKFVAQSIAIGADEMTALSSGTEVGEFLQSHQDIPAEDIAYYIRLFERVSP